MLKRDDNNCNKLWTYTILLTIAELAIALFFRSETKSILYGILMAFPILMLNVLLWYWYKKKGNSWAIGTEENAVWPLVVVGLYVLIEAVIVPWLQGHGLIPPPPPVP